MLVNNVGAARVRLDGFLALSDSDFEASLQLNFFAALRATRAAVADMTKRGKGTIVNVASVNAFFEPDGAVIDYGAAKAALVNVAKSLSQNSGHRASGSPVSRQVPWQRDLWLGRARCRGHGRPAATRLGRTAFATGHGAWPPGGSRRKSRRSSRCRPDGNVTGANWVIDGGCSTT